MGSGTRRMVLWLDAVCVVALLAAGVSAAVRFEEKKPYPDAWDARVLPLVGFVERERGFTFAHPVFVDFLAPSEYSERIRSDDDLLGAEDEEELLQWEAMLRAFGLIAADVSLLDTVNDITDAGTLAYYDSGEDRITVRGTELTPKLRATLVHELTHALQDQTFDLNRFKEDDEEATHGQMNAFHALVEGDADRIEVKYVESLTDEEQDSVVAASDDAASAVEEAPSEALAALFSVPYALGDPFVDLLHTVAPSKIDEAFGIPPRSEEQILDPFAYLDGDQPRAVPTPDVDGLEVVDEGDFGAATLLVVLAERIDVRQALAAVTGWGGDAYAVFHREGNVCARVHVVGDTPTDTDELDGALRAWAEAVTTGTVSVTRTGEFVAVESCDPGSRATPGSGRSLEALDLASARSWIASASVEDGAQWGEARCYATGVVNEVDVEEIQRGPSRRVLAAIAQRCRARAG